MKLFAKKYLWLLIYGVFLILDLTLATVFANKGGIGHVDGRSYLSHLWPLVIFINILGAGDVGWSFAALYQIALIVILLIYVILWIIKVIKKRESISLLVQITQILLLLILNTASMASLATNYITQGSFIFFKSEKHIIPMFAFFGWIVVLVSKSAIDIYRKSMLKKTNK